MASEVVADNGMNEGIGAGNAPVSYANAQSSQGFINDIISDPQKRLYAIIGVSVVAVLLVTFIYVGAQPKNENRGKLVPLVQELNQSRAFEIIAKLKSVNIEAKVVNGEKPGEYIVQVYEKAIETAYLALSRTNLLEDEGYGLFDQNDWAASDYDKRIKLTRAINGDLSKIISRLDGLRTAIVRVNIPEQQLFTEQQAPTTATVQLELENDAEKLSKTQIQSIVNVLRGYIQNIKEDHISIVDTQGNNYSAYKEETESDVEDYIDEVEKINTKMKERISKYLDAILGAEDYKVSVSASVSREKIEQQETTYTEGAVGSRQTGTEYLNQGENAAVPAAGATNGKNYSHQSVNESLLPSFEQKHTTYLPGRVTDVTVALALDKSVPSMVSLKQLQESVAAIIGPDIDPENVKITIADLHAKDQLEAPVKAVETPQGWFDSMGFWGKAMTIIGFIALALIASLFGLSFLSSFANKDSQAETDIYPDLGNEFEDDVPNNDTEADNDGEDYGEKEALRQQEALLKEMMSQSAPPKYFEQEQSNIYDKGSMSNPGFERGDTRQNSPLSLSGGIGNSNNEEIKFESLLNNFESVANRKPDLLAKKIEVWLDEKE
ncbi:MAG: flagellar M-ring protein FliF C-terminal domain-containing protein [Candidatus Melainabacteria bacterium]|nr:flagellar M-ring protein FliF C-terminal domain-containing protein [Candidatus Melainabacteria bacterium]